MVRYWPAVVAFIVVIEHLRSMIWLSNAQVPGMSIFMKAMYFVTGIGHEAVMAFFVLSGFWISKTVDKRVGNDGFWPDYILNRSSRLLVALIPALVIGGLFDLIGIHVFHGLLYTGESGSMSLSYDVSERLTWGAFLGNIVFLQTLLAPTFGSNGPLWSLTHEFWYYLWYPALVLLLGKRRFTLMLASIVIGLAWPKLLPGFLVWMLGSCLYQVEKRGIGRALPKNAARLAMVLLLGVTVVGIIVARLDLVPEAVSNLLVGLGIFGLFWSLLLVNPAVPRMLKPIAAYGSASSYSLYISHFPFLALAATVLLAGKRLAPDSGALLLFVAVTLAALVYGWLFSQATEKNTAAVRTWVKDALERRFPAMFGPERGRAGIAARSGAGFFRVTKAACWTKVPALFKQARQKRKRVHDYEAERTQG
jgi:peptidoglycan/LPS O-acetylase OafA/YrhL